MTSLAQCIYLFFVFTQGEIVSICFFIKAVSNLNFLEYIGQRHKKTSRTKKDNLCDCYVLDCSTAAEVFDYSGT